MEVANRISEKLKNACHPQHLELVNESHMHAGPASDSHFKLVMVASEFADLSAVKRHQLVYKVLQEELAGPVHALALHLYSPQEWQDAGNVPDSPLCAGKNT